MRTFLYIILGIIILNFIASIINICQNYFIQPNNNDIVYVQQPQQTQLEVVVVKQKPTLGECILAPVDLVAGIYNGVLCGIGNCAVYITNKCTIGSLYTDNNWCIYCKQYNSNCECK